ncbi:nucleoporin p58/p45 isoform X2 [Babesia caballi]|uniref:Nucleoporin p58/p45 isoform X2 n=1 Tax=Babesia caballi TaxID=5871 RepID=A0AAV4M2W6_BABCB|nr:nucleoporin p58/p45 isoform X2 [Babesia caballi]
MGNGRVKPSWKTRKPVEVLRQCNHLKDVLRCGAQRNAGRDVQLGLDGVAVVRKANEKPRTKSIPPSYAVTDSAMDERLGVLGRSTALDEAREACVHISTPLGSKVLGERCDVGVQRLSGWPRRHCA